MQAKVTFKLNYIEMNQNQTESKSDLNSYFSVN